MGISLKLREDVSFMLDQLTDNKNDFISSLIVEKFKSLPMQENVYTKAFLKYKDGMEEQEEFSNAVEYYVSIGILIKHFQCLSNKQIGSEKESNSNTVTRLLNKALKSTDAEEIISLFTNWCFKAGLSKKLYTQNKDTNLLAMVYQGTDKELKTEEVRAAILTGYIYGEGIENV